MYCTAERVEQRVVLARRDAVLEHAVREDGVGAADLRAAADGVLEERAVVADHLEAQAADAAAGVAVAAVVGLQRALPLAEADEGRVQDVEEARRRPHRAVRSEREDRVALDVVDLERRRDAPDHFLQQLGDERRPVLDLGGGNEGREARDVRQNQKAVLGRSHRRPPVAVTRESRGREMAGHCFSSVGFM